MKCELHVRMGFQKRAEPSSSCASSRLSAITCTSLPPRLARHDVVEELDEGRTGVPRHGLPEHLPVRVFSAAYSESVPCR